MTTAAQRAQEAAAVQMITDGIAALNVVQAVSALQWAICQHPAITPNILHSAGNLLSRAADEMERNHEKTG